MDDTSRPTHSTSSSLSLSSTLLDEQDEDVRIAVKALGDMRNSTVGGIPKPTPALSTVPSPALPDNEVPAEGGSEVDFVRRVSHIPLVNGALRMYEQGKASSRVVKYGAEIMESSVKTISRPVFERLPTGQLDDFACRQLDRMISLPPIRDLLDELQLDKYRRPSYSSQEHSPLSPGGRTSDDRISEPRYRDDSHWPSSSDDIYRRNRGEGVGTWLQSTSSQLPRPLSPESPGQSRSSTPTLNGDTARYYPRHTDLSLEAGPPGSSHHDNHSGRRDSQDQRQVVQRSRWHTMLLEAGGFGAAWSEESMRKLRYVLQWLQYATNHIDEQILVLRGFTASLQQQYFDSPHSLATPTSTPKSVRGGRHSRSNSESISEAHMHKLTNIRRDVVHTVREVVSVVSKYGGGASLPEPARNAMKGFILKLPKKVSEAMRIGGGSSTVSVPLSAGASSTAGVTETERDSVAAAASGRAGSDRRGALRRGRGRGVGSHSAAASPVSSRATSPASSPRVNTRALHASPSEEEAPGTGSSRTMSAGTAVIAAQRILTLASESLDMMRGVTGVVKDSLDRADAWVERLKVVGVRGDSGPGSEGTAYPTPTPSAAEQRDRELMQHYRESGGTLSPLTRSRGGSVSSVEYPFGSGESTAYTSYGGSLPSTPGLGGYAYGPLSGPMGPPVDAPSPEVGLGLRRMSIKGEDEVKQEEVDDLRGNLRTPMEVDD